MSGVSKVYYSINKAEYQEYTKELPFNQEGYYVLKYYAVDRVGNVEKPVVQTFIVDNSAPKTYHNVVGIAKDKIISVSTKLYLTPTDTSAKIAKTYYRFDDEAYRLYQTENINFQYLADGDHVLNYYSVDNVGNTEKENTLPFFYDKTAPIMSADILGDKFIVRDKVYFSGRTKLKLTAVDNKAGVKKVLYSIDNSDFDEYKDPFYLPNKAGMHIVKYFAMDFMENGGTG